MSLRTFQQPINLQQSSMLMRLPLELRWIILRLLMAGSAHLRSLAELEDWRRAAGRMMRCYGKQMRLSSHILQCCQRLYQEGGGVLYRNNILSLRFRRCGEVLVCDFLDVSVRIPSHPLEYPKHGFPFSTFISTFRARLIELSDVLRAEQILSRFGIIEVTMPSDLPADIFVICRILRDTCQDKHISIRGESFYHEEPDDVTSWVRCFQSLRCRAVEFIGLEKENVHEINELITSDKPIVDLLLAAQELHDLLVERDVPLEGVEDAIANLDLSMPVEEAMYKGLKSVDVTEQLSRLWTAVFEGDEDWFRITWMQILDHTRQELNDKMQAYTSTMMRLAEEDTTRIMQKTKKDITEFQKSTIVSHEYIAWLARMNLGQTRGPETNFK